jgi:hypothetical protein
MTPYPISDEWKAAGLQFQDQFTNFNLSYLNGGVFIGGPPVNDGVRLDGTNQYVYYDTPRFHAAAGFTIELKFVPNFEFGDSANHYIFDSTPTTGLSLLKHLSNVLVFYVNTTQIFASGSFGAYWLTGKENTLIISASSGDTTAYLNGIKVVDSDATAFSNFLITRITLGAAFSGVQGMPGTIKSFRFFMNAFTDADCEKLYDGRLLSELDPEKATLFAGLRSSYTNGAGEEVTPVLINGETQEMFLGSDGKTAGEYPTLFSPRGARVDGGDHFNAGNRSQFTFAIPGGGDLPFGVFIYFATSNPATISGIFGKYSGTFSSGEWGLHQIGAKLRFALLDQDGLSIIFKDTIASLVANKAIPWTIGYNGSGLSSGINIFEGEILAASATGSVGASYTQMRSSSENLEIFKFGASFLQAGSRAYVAQVINVEPSPAQARMWAARAKRLKNV